MENKLRLEDEQLGRKYTFLKNKYNELLLPTLFMVMSEKLCVIIDILIIGILLGSIQASVINLASPFTYITGIFYILFGQGGNLLVLRAQSQLDHEKTNFYFTIAITGIIIVSIIYILIIYLFMDNILMILNVPAEIFNLGKEYLSILMFYYPLNCFMLVISFFIRSDGFPKMPFYAVLIANVLNIILDLLFLKVFNWGIASTALASVLGYLVGTIYISKYLFKEERSYRLISLAKFKIKEIILSLKDIILNTPEVIGKIFFASKISMLTYLCSTHYGVAGLLAFLVYDNSETFIYMFLSGIMKTMSPIVTVLYKELDYEAVHYIIIRSLKQVLIISFPVSVLFFVYPEILLGMFNVVEPYHVKVVTLSIRITSFSLVGRCMSYLFANYTQAIEKNMISSVIIFLEEGLFAVAGALILTNIVGGVGIWISILLAECMPLLIYIIYTFKLQISNKDNLKNILMLQNSKLITWTYAREEIGTSIDDLDEKSNEVIHYIGNIFKNKTFIITKAVNDICDDLFEKDGNLKDIDITIRLIDEKLYIVLTTDGKLYNPFLNESLMKSDNLTELSKLKCEFEYDEILGFNKEYITVEN